MEPDFALVAVRLSGLTISLLQWTPAQFWQATPDEIATIFRSLDSRGSDAESETPLDKKQLQSLKDIFPDG